MIASGYALDLYCDREDAHSQGAHTDNRSTGFFWAAQYATEEKREALAVAKREGWKFSLKAGTCLCPWHAKEKR